MRKLSPAVVAATLVVSMLHGVVPGARAGTGPVIYLPLGDSLSTGFQPGRGETTNGYVTICFGISVSRSQSSVSGNVGCSGETSRSMITGTNSPCRYAAGSQLDAAVSFLEAHPGQVAFITIDVGANDLLDRCLDFDTGLIDRGFTVDLLPRLQTRLTHIVETLAVAAGTGVPIVGMTYYNPFLGLWDRSPGVARWRERTSEPGRCYGALATAYADAGASVADVAATFRIDDFTHTVVVPGRGRIPANVALACRWTWFCSTRFFGDPHADRTGHRKIARTFERELQGLLP